uniref:Uncharacterized protein n=1 Tax=Cacopsylla melanoneura TaxID=428564 RepID=A0A8D8T0M2_9HEMI
MPTKMTSSPLTLSQCLSLFLSFSLKMASGKTTEPLTDSHVIRAMKSYVDVGSTFPSVVDFFLHLKNETENDTEPQAGSKPLPQKLIQMYQIARLVNLGVIK